MINTTRGIIYTYQNRPTAVLDYRTGVFFHLTGISTAGFKNCVLVDRDALAKLAQYVLAKH